MTNKNNGVFVEILKRKCMHYLVFKIMFERNKNLNKQNGSVCFDLFTKYHINVLN